MISKGKLILKLFVAVLAGVNCRFGMLDDHVTAETEGVHRALAAQLAAVVAAVVVRLHAHLQELHNAEP